MRQTIKSSIKIQLSIALLLFTVTLVAIAFSSSSVSASTDIIDNIELTVPVACTMSGTGQTSHNASLSPGTYSGASGSEYEAGIGKTTITTYCNDNNGFSIYAIGFTGDLYEGETHTKLIGQNTNLAISTKVYSSSDTDSNWSMKVTKVDNPVSGDPITYNPDNMSIQNSFNSWHTVPDVYTKVAQYNSSTTDPATTDTTLGAKIETTYATYISSSQPADTYTGQVKYTMVHPYNETPVQSVACAAGKICYNPNSNLVEGTMGQQSATDGNSIMLLASNFSRTGYGFAGWSDKYDYATNDEANFYGPQETITVPTDTTKNGLSLYAMWVKSNGIMQNWTDCSSLAPTIFTENNENPNDWSIAARLDSITALTDNRDGQTYAIARLSDSKCWMLENLRISDSHQERTGILPTTLTINNTNNPLNNGHDVTLIHNYSDTETFSTLSPSSSNASYSWCTDRTASCFNQSRVIINNTASRSNNPNKNTGINIYSYGHYYNWYSATAGRGTYDKNSGNTIGDLCPNNWRLPTGTGSGDYGLLTNSMGGYNDNGIALGMSNSTTPTASTMAIRLRHFPNNLLYSGLDDSRKGADGFYFTSTARNNEMAYNFYFGNTAVEPGTYSSMGVYKSNGNTIRCVYAQ